MSVSAGPSNGGGFGTFLPPSSFPLTFPQPTTVSFSVTSFSVVIQESVTVSISSTTASTTQSTTESTTSYITVSTTLHTTFSTQGPIITAVPTASLAAEDSILRSSASLTKTNTIIIGALGGALLLVILLLVILLCLFIRRRRHDREGDSPPFTPLAPQIPLAFLPTTQSAPSLPQHPGTSVSMGPRSAGYVPQAFTSYPPNRPSRPLIAPAVQRTQPIPAINIQPNTPSVFARDDSSPISPILQPGAAQMPLYHEALQEEAEDSRARRQTEAAQRLGVPVIERENRRSQSASVSSIGSEVGFEDNEHEESDREREKEDRQRRTERGERVLHSTRASSGVFPEH